MKHPRITRNSSAGEQHSQQTSVTQTGERLSADVTEGVRHQWCKAATEAVDSRIVAHIAVAMLGVLRGQLTDDTHDERVGVGETNPHAPRRDTVVGTVSIAPNNFPLNFKHSVRIGKLQTQTQLGMQWWWILA